MDTNVQSIISRIEAYKDILIKWQTELTAVPALGPENGGNGEMVKGFIVKKILEDLKPDELKEIHAPDERVDSKLRPNYLAIWNGKNTENTLWIMSHIDVVPPGELSLWDTDPFKAVEKDGKIYGRGTEDDQQGMVSSLLCVKAFRDENIMPNFNIGLAVVADEENGSKYGIQYVLSRAPEYFKPNDMILIPDAGDAEGLAIEVAEKSIMWFKFEITGRQTHGSTPEKGINAHRAGAHLITRMDELYEIFNEKDALYDPPISTFEPTKKEGNVDNVNTIPGKDIIYYDCRILPSIDVDSVIKHVEKIKKEIENEFKVKVDYSFPQKEIAPPPTPADTPAAKAIKKAVKELRNKDAFTLGIGGGTVAAYFRRAGLPAVCWCTLDDTLHAPNEYCVIQNVLDDAKVFAHIALQNIDD